MVLTSGGYGPTNISQPVIITALGVDASITQATSGQIAITVDTPGNVTLIGLSLHGEGIGFDGVFVKQVGVLRLYDMLIESFANSGVDFGVAGKLSIYHLRINDISPSNAGVGLFVYNASASVYVSNSSFDNNFIGVMASPGQVVVADSSANNNNGAFNVQLGTVTLFNVRVTSNSVALVVFPGGLVSFADCLFANNTTFYDIEPTGLPLGLIRGSLPGTSLITRGQATIGPPPGVITLQ